MKAGSLERNTVILAVLALAAWSVAEGRAQEMGRARVRGKVRSELGEPIPNAKVVLKHKEFGMVIERSTNEKGEWIAYGLRAGKWDVDVVAEGYEPHLATMNVSEAQRNRPLTVNLRQAAPTPDLAPEDGVSALATEAHQAYQAGDYQHALDLYQQFLSASPEIEQTELWIGSCYVQMRKYDQGLAYFKTYLEKHPEDSEALLLTGDAYILKGDVDTGIGYLEQVGLGEVSDPMLCYNMGEIYFRNANSEKAAEAYGKATELDPSFHEAYYKLGLVAIGENDMETARQHLRKVIELAPDSQEATLAQQMLEQIG
jgi:tetratricopeptide (TPR) repeat protein